MRLFTIGIDEVGRGPLAGPVVVCALAILDELDLIKSLASSLKYTQETLKDSKKLTPRMREEWSSVIVQARERKLVDYELAYRKAGDIDTRGIAVVIREAVVEALNRLVVRNSLDTNCDIKLDGSLKAPIKYTRQETIVKGDEKILAIALASIVAKVDRDLYMDRLGQKYPQYGFSQHKGYGTKLHIDMIHKYGLSLEHRATFCRNITHPYRHATSRDLAQGDGPSRRCRASKLGHRS